MFTLKEKLKICVNVLFAKHKKATDIFIEGYHAGITDNKFSNEVDGFVKRIFTKETVIPNVPFEDSVILEGVYAVDANYLIALVDFYQRHTSV